tara:strand:+ start:522 stop:890 length:369 start_codon:yes stop_codon:yes gene_type:complete
MGNLAVKLPITRDSINGFTMISNLDVLIKQNFKMLILTNPGERVMIPDFGVGITQYLFENFSDSTFLDIENRIKQQVAKYLPVVILGSINFDSSDQDANKLGVSITYQVPALNIKDLLQFTI